MHTFSTSKDGMGEMGFRIWDSIWVIFFFLCVENDTPPYADSYPSIFFQLHLMDVCMM
jgi:hypothetical protein